MIENFNDVVKPHLSSMERVALSVTKNYADAQDAVQEALIKAYTKAHLYNKTKGSLGNWLRAITYFTAIDALRVRRKHDSYLDKDDKSSMDIEELVHLQNIEDAYGILSDRNKVVVSCLAQGLTNTEIATRFGITYNAATVMIHRARTRFKEKLLLQEIEI